MRFFHTDIDFRYYLCSWKYNRKTSLDFALSELVGSSKTFSNMYENNKWNAKSRTETVATLQIFQQTWKQKLKACHSKQKAYPYSSFLYQVKSEPLAGGKNKNEQRKQNQVTEGKCSEWCYSSEIPGIWGLSKHFISDFPQTNRTIVSSSRIIVFAGHPPA